MIIKQLIYIAAVLVVMIIASRYMKKIKDRPDEEIPEDIEHPVAEDLEIDDAAG
ncbi:MAG: hypothetical protein LBH19_11075 [Dysgonamonadaceae bacterium]|jgi:hypothetical protein|nr:hypothetical protein [Dysgonamonadaceae bacterium]